MGIVEKFIRKKYGVNVSFPNPAIVVLNAVASVQVLQDNPNRFSWTIQNMGAAIAYVSPDPAVGALNGIGLAALGGLVSFDADVDGVIPTRGVWGIGAAATTLIVYEVLGG